MATNKELTAHIRRVAKSNDIRIRWMDTDDGAVAIDRRKRIELGKWEHKRSVRIPRVKGDSSLNNYWTGLHELGHHLAARKKLRIEEEQAAWEWALGESEVRPTREVWLHIYHSVASYLRSALNGGRCTVPHGDDFKRFWANLKVQAGVTQAVPHTAIPPTRVKPSENLIARFKASITLIMNKVGTIFSILPTF